MSARIKIITVIYVLILAGIIFLANSRGTRYLLNFVGNIPFGDKIGHFLLMGILSFLINLTLQCRSIGIGKLKYLLGSILVLLIVSIEEFSQIFVRGRTFDLYDLIADTAGILIFGELARLVCDKFFARQKS